MRKKTCEEYIAEVAVKNPNIEVIEKYIDDSTKILHRCKICGHEWKVSPSKILQDSGCPQCSQEYHMSNSEIKIFYYIKKYFPNAISRYNDKECGITEIDILIPNLMIGIEYDGARWHQDIERDKKKDIICQNNNINLIRIREPKCPKYTSTCQFIFLQDLSQKSLKNTIEKVLNILGIDNIIINFNKDLQDIASFIMYKNKENSLGKLFPDIAKELHPNKNGNLTAENLSAYSNKQVWWLCPNGHEYVARVSHRTSKGRGCNECRKKRIYCKELKQIFPSLNEAARITNVELSNIGKCCQGKVRSAGKHPITGEFLHWYYVEDQKQKDSEIIFGAISLGLITRKQYEDYLNDM